jgi:uncharacterized protein (DUF433 family)
MCGGKPRIAGTRFKVQQVAIEYVHAARTVEQILKSHPHLNLAQIHAALSYHYDHQNEIEEDIQEGWEYAEQMEAGLI